MPPFVPLVTYAILKYQYIMLYSFVKLYEVFLTVYKCNIISQQDVLLQQKYNIQNLCLYNLATLALR